MQFEIQGRAIGEKYSPYLIAELSGNHKQSLDLAKSLIRAAARSGADAVKLQTYTADTLTLPCRNSSFRINGGLWAGRHLHDLYNEAMTPWEWHRPMAELAANEGMALFSTPFDETAVAFLEDQINPPVYKVSSFEITHIPLLKVVGETGKPVILSTGMATADEINNALQTLSTAGSSGVTLLKCVSAYPAEPEDFNLRSLTALRNRFNCPVGLSDHTFSNDTALGAVALGACVIEKHLTLDRSNGAVDNGFSLEPNEFSEMAKAVKRLHRSLGSEKIGATTQEIGQKRFRRSIFVSSAIRKGDFFTKENLKIVRPADGLPPARWEQILEQPASCDIPAGTPLKEEHLALNGPYYASSEAENCLSHA